MGPSLSPVGLPGTPAQVRLTHDQIVKLIAERAAAQQMVQSLLCARPVQPVAATFPELDEEADARRPRVAVRTLWSLQDRRAIA